MKFGNKPKVFLLLLGDVISLYASLFLMLFLRYGGNFYVQFQIAHFLPFTIIFAIWIVVFFIAGLYDLRQTRNSLEFAKSLNLTILVNAFLAVLFFYLVPFFGITPKTNLFVFLVIFVLFEVWWRRKFNAAIASSSPQNKVLLVGGHGAKPINDIVVNDPQWLAQLGYEVLDMIGEEEASRDPERLRATVKSKSINSIVVPRKLKNNPQLAKVLYGLMSEGVEVCDLPNFYELIARKVPLADLEETWFLENLSADQKFYEPLKRAAEFFAALLLFTALLPLQAIIALLIKLTSAGPVIYKQPRIGQHGRTFILYKFRTMKVHNEHFWPEENDTRITKVGRFLRKAHLDEWPQLINILKGDISVVGPRPDFVDFYKKLEKEIPYYAIRMIIRPGLTGWAQIHKPITASLEDTKERLEYDLYYLKNRSLVLDAVIVLKTLKVLFTAKGL